MKITIFAIKIIIIIITLLIITIITNIPKHRITILLKHFCKVMQLIY